MNLQETKKGRKPNITHTCSCCQKSFQDAASKCKHEFYMRTKKAKSEATKSHAGNLATLDDFHLQPNIQPPTKENLKQLQQTSGSAFRTFKPTILDGQQLLATSLGPSIQDHGDILIERSSEEEKISQGQGSSSSNTNSQHSNQPPKESLEDVERHLSDSVAWQKVKEMVDLGAFETLKDLSPSRDLYVSFLLQGCPLLDKIPQRFPSALAVAYKWLLDNKQKIPKIVLVQYTKFFEKYRGHKKQHLQERYIYLQELRTLFKLCRDLQASVKWVKSLSEPDLLMGEKAVLMGCSTTLRLLFECKDFYTHDYFDLIDYIMDQSELAARNAYGFTNMLQTGKVRADTTWRGVFQRYARLENTYRSHQVTKIGAQILGVLVDALPVSLALDIVELALTLNRCEEIKTVLRNKQQFQSFQEFMVLLNLQQEKEQLKAEELQRKNELDEKQKETKRKKVEEEDARAKLEEEQIRIQEAKKKEEKEEHLNKLQGCLSNFLHMNPNIHATMEEVLAFEKTLQEVATNINVVLKPEQVVTMALLLLSKNHTTLVQLATGTGKSLMLGILAQFLNQTTGKKVIVVVPTSFLHAYQQNLYCPDACKVPEDMGESDCKYVFYCDFKRFSSPEFIAPADTILLVDEFHALFFDQQAQLVNGKVISVVTKMLAATKVIGMSATYRGDTGIKKISQILQASTFVKPPQELQEKKLCLNVFGEEQDIPARAVKLAQIKQQEMPVIVFCQDTEEYKKLLPQAKVFDGEEVGMLNAILKYCRTSSDAIILTTSATSKGVDFVFSVPQAFVILTSLPKTLVQLKQDSGRGVRGNNLPVIGALITDKTYFSLEDVELGLEHSEQFDKLYPSDYLKSLQYLERLPTPTTDHQHRVLAEAIATLNACKPFTEVQKVLSKSTIFKKHMPFNFSGKRTKPEEERPNECQVVMEIQQEEVDELGEDNIELQEAHEERQKKPLTQGMVDSFFRRSKQTNDKEEEKDDSMPIYGFDCNPEAEQEPQVELKETVVKELAKQKAKEVLAEGKKQQQEKSMKSSAILFGSEAGKSKVSRTQYGKFVGGKEINGQQFVRAGTKHAKQRWQCCACKKHTVYPQEHNCNN